MITASVDTAPDSRLLFHPTRETRASLRSVMRSLSMEFCLCFKQAARGKTCPNPWTSAVALALYVWFSRRRRRLRGVDTSISQSETLREMVHTPRSWKCDFSRLGTCRCFAAHNSVLFTGRDCRPAGHIETRSTYEHNESKHTQNCHGFSFAVCI